MGCPGSDQQGPPSAGTICSDGSVLVPDSTLPPGCPGSSQQGPPAPNTFCSARPGRPDCTIQSGKCLTANGVDVSTQGIASGSLPAPAGPNKCGEGDDAVTTSIDIGCRGVGNPIIDMLLAFVKFLTLGASIIMIGALIVAGIQFSTSQSNPQARANAIKRIATVLGALVLFIFTYALLMLNAISLTIWRVMAVTSCNPKGSFFGLPTWYKYLPGEQIDNNLTGIPGAKTCSVVITRLSDVWLIGAAILELLLRLAALVAIGFVVWGGIQYILSQAEPQRTKAARETIINALIGLVIAVAASTIIAFVAGRFK